MKVAKNMDSVFANCTEDELDFDLLFSNDDTIIDFVAGVDESGIPLTGPNYDYSKILAEADMLEDDDDQDERDGKIKHNGAAEGSKDEDLEVGAEVGDGKEVSGKEKSAESEAHDMVELGSETAKQKAIEKAMEIGAQKFADADSVKENCEYDGYDTLIEAVIGGFMSEEEILSEDASKIAISTADYLIKECEDVAARDGKVDPENKKYVEGVKSKVKDEMTQGKAQGDNFEDPCDAGARAGKIAIDNKNVEGVANRIIGAAMEAAANGILDAEMKDQTIDPENTDMDKEIVPDSIQNNTSSNDIDITHENVCKFVKERYAGLVGGMNKELQDLALAACLDESVLEVANAIKETALSENCQYSDYVEYQTVVEAVIANLNESQIEKENCSEFVFEAANYLIEKSNDSNFIDCNVNSKGKAVLADFKAFAHDVGSDVKRKIADTAENVKKHPGKTAAVVAGAAGAAVLAKKIADKKKKAKEEQQQNVKENYEYPEFNSLLEAVIDGFTEEEIMAENASEMAETIANILIENAEKEAVYDDPDGDDIEDVASQKDSDENPGVQYDYDDDELIDLVINDDEI